jgi:hypothetical protein
MLVQRSGTLPPAELMISHRPEKSESVSEARGKGPKRLGAGDLERRALRRNRRRRFTSLLGVGFAEADGHIRADAPRVNPILYSR